MSEEKLVSLCFMNFLVKIGIRVITAVFWNAVPARERFCIRRLPFLVVFFLFFFGCVLRRGEIVCLLPSQWWLNVWKVSRVINSCLRQLNAYSVNCVLCDLLPNFGTAATVKINKYIQLMHPNHILNNDDDELWQLFTLVFCPYAYRVLSFNPWSVCLPLHILAHLSDNASGLFCKTGGRVHAGVTVQQRRPLALTQIGLRISVLTRTRPGVLLLMQYDLPGKICIKQEKKLIFNENTWAW